MTIPTAVLTLLLAHLGVVYADRSLSLLLSGPPEVVDVDNFSVVTNVTNTGDEALQLYKSPYSVLSSFPENSFVVSASGNDGAVVPSFIGAKAKYSFKHDTNFVTLNPGDSFITSHTLSSAYNFTAPGTYSINPSPDFSFYDPATQGPSPIRATLSNTHSAKLSGTLESTIIAKRLAKYLDKRTFSADDGRLEKRYSHVGNCSPSELSDLSNAIQSSADYLSSAISYLKGPKPSGERYTRWFGSYSTSRKSKVLDHFQRIKSSDPSTYTYMCCNRDLECECSAQDSTFAYVYENKPYEVFLCNSFYQAAVTGTDSKAGTIIHEASHFDVNGGTDDDPEHYGQEGSHEIAEADPNKAIKIADCHEYFAENNPALG